MHPPRVAVIHDWLTLAGGAERVLMRICGLLPKADIFTLINNQKALPKEFANQKTIHASWLNRLPGVDHYYRWLAPLMPAAIESLDLRPYDLVISGSWAFAHGVRKNPTARHLAYIHSPMRWAWDMEDAYLEHARFSGPLKQLARNQLERLRKWDHAAGQRPNRLVANSGFVAQRIQKFWGRQAAVVYPPVAPLPTPASVNPHGAFVSVCRLVPYKRVDFWIDVFKKLPNQRLLIAGEGPEANRLKAMAPSNVTFLGRIPDVEVAGLIAGARGFLQASLEDFGISVIEAQALGCPVIALGQGGALETVNAWPAPGASGVLLERLDTDLAAEVIAQFETYSFSPDDCRKNAAQFSPERFDGGFALELETLGFSRTELGMRV